MPDDQSEILVLIDYDNVVVSKPERTITDVETNLSAIARGAGELVKSYRAGAHAARVRLYGGWVSERNQYTQRAEWVLARLGLARGRSSGVLLVPDFVEGIAACMNARLIGSFRRGRDRNEQKMVDTMLSVDALHYAAQGHTVIIASDDDDMVPAALAVRNSYASHLALARHRPVGVGLNDRLCQVHGIDLIALPPAFSR